MGYMGLSTFVDSDNASDFVHDVHDCIAKLMLMELRNKANNMNTDGVINVALFAEAHLYNLSSKITFFENSQMFDALHKLRDAC